MVIGKGVGGGVNAKESFQILDLQRLVSLPWLAFTCYLFYERVVIPLSFNLSPSLVSGHFARKLMCPKVDAPYRLGISIKNSDCTRDFSSEYLKLCPLEFYLFFLKYKYLDFLDH